MGKLISLAAAALALTACSNPTAPRDQSVEAAKAKAALGAVAKGAETTRTGAGKLAAN